MRRVADLLHGIKGSHVAEGRGGMPTMPPDGSYLIDEEERACGLYFLTGCNVMGSYLCPRTGGRRWPIGTPLGCDRIC